MNAEASAARDPHQDLADVDLNADLAPIALFAFRRPDHTRRTVEALSANVGARQSRLVAFCDGPRRETDVADVEAVRRIVREAHGFAAVEIIEQPVNLGLARSIIAGVSTLLARFPQLIVVEDDLVTSPHFLAYMNNGLRLYADDARVASIHGYVYPVEGALPETFFLRGADCWGWATWRRAWSVFEPDARLLAERMRAAGLERLFDMDGVYPYMQMLADCEQGRVDSWAIRWHAATFLKDMLTLFPGRSLVQNIGHDGSGTHQDDSSVFDTDLDVRPIKVRRIPFEVDENARRMVADVLREAGHVDEPAPVGGVEPRRTWLGALWRLVRKIGGRPG